MPISDEPDVLEASRPERALGPIDMLPVYRDAPRSGGFTKLRKRSVRQTQEATPSITRSPVLLRSA